MMNRLKSFAITVILLTACLRLSGQKNVTQTDPWDDEKFFNIGYSFGINAMTFRITPSEQYLATDSLHARAGSLYPGINIHMAINFKINQFFDIRLLPGISFGQRMIAFESDRINDTVLSPQKIESSFIELPLLLRYGWRMNDSKPYIIAGLNFRYDFYAQEKYRLERPVYLRLSRPDMYFEIGTGIEFYLSHIKLGIEIKYSGGSNDVIVHDPHPDYPQYCNAIEELKSHIWVLSFHFE
jgi:hypothetical protein